MNEAKEPKRAAKNNPVPTGDEARWTNTCWRRRAKNRETWNRWMAPRLSDAAKTALRAKGWSDQELTPFSEDERQSIVVQVGSPLEADQIDFSDTLFEAAFYAEGFVFPHVDFGSATFSGSADFESATFSHYAGFSSTSFSGDALFDRTTFSGSADFRSATFSGNADFESATFSRYAGFSSTSFSGDALFVNATFGRIASVTSANFSSATFSVRAYFLNATFNGSATFVSVNFSSRAYFVNVEMKGPTTFDNVQFSEPPQCFNAKLHEGTTWHGVRWPETPRVVEQARQFIDAYARLKLEMDKLKNHEDELNFFALELRCRRVVEGFWKGLPIAIYGGLSDYGRSYERPLVLIAAVLLVGAFLAALHLVGFWAPIPGRAFGLSFANTFSVLGIHREFTNPDTIKSYPEWLTVVATVQSILGIVLLFLFGLGIRNRFRIK